MKNNIIILVILFLASIAISCTKESKDVSSITTYPEIKLSGDQFMTIPAGSTYTEPGVSVMLGSSQMPFTTTGTVDGNTPGVYIIEYSAINAEGFSASERRWVGVIKADVGGDYSGTYKRSSNGVLTHLTKITNGLYVTDNVGGVDPVASPEFTYDVRIFNTKDSTFVIPPQPSAVGGDVTCTGVSHSPLTGLGQYKYVVVGTSYGTSVRTFNKQ